MLYAKKHTYLTLSGADENADRTEKVLPDQARCVKILGYDLLLFFGSHAHASPRDAVAADKLEPQCQKVTIRV
jgi:hypothetical protein